MGGQLNSGDYNKNLSVRFIVCRGALKFIRASGLKNVKKLRTRRRRRKSGWLEEKKEEAA